MDGHFFGGRICCWVGFCGLNFGIRLGLRDSGAYSILVVEHVLKLNKGTKHWRLRAFIIIAAQVRLARRCMGLSWVSGFGLWGWAWWQVWLLEGHLFFHFARSLAFQVVCDHLREIQFQSG